MNKILKHSTNLILLIALFGAGNLLSQSDKILTKDTVEDFNTIDLTIDGRFFSAMITESGDTLILADLDDISITSFRGFEDDADYRKYMLFRRYSAKVFPYAKEAIRIFREYEYAQQFMSRRAKKKKLKQLNKELTAEFEEPLKRLTKLQGKIMMKMIEKELDTSMYALIKNFKGGLKAFYWNKFSMLFSYDLKEGYHRGTYPILDAVLDDFDIDHRIESTSTMKYINFDELKKRKTKRSRR